MTRAKKEDKALVKVLYIYYPIRFKKDITNIKVFLDLDSKINAMTLVNISKLGFRICRTDIVVQKIGKSTFAIFGIIIPSFQI